LGGRTFLSEAEASFYLPSFFIYISLALLSFNLLRPKGSVSTYTSFFFSSFISSLTFLTGGYIFFSSLIFLTSLTGGYCFTSGFGSAWFQKATVEPKFSLILTELSILLLPPAASYLSFLRGAPFSTSFLGGTLSFWSASLFSNPPNSSVELKQSESNSLTD